VTALSGGLGWRAWKIGEGVGGTGLAETALLEFAATGTGARVVWSGFRLYAAVGVGRNLCIFVHVFRLWFGFGDGRFGEGSRDLMEDRESSLEAHGGRRLGVGEDGANGFDGGFGQGFGLVAKEQGTIVLGMGEFCAEQRGVAAPVTDGIAMDSGCGGGSGERRAIGKRGNDLVLEGRELR